MSVDESAFALGVVASAAGLTILFAATFGLAEQLRRPSVVDVAWGLGLEAVGDTQLRTFKADPGNQGKIMDRGLWRYTRHPNFFGDACVWWGIWLVMAETGAGAWTVLSPVVMTLFLTRGSGARLAEKRMAGRPGFDEYVARTSGFFPLPPRPTGDKGAGP